MSGYIERQKAFYKSLTPVFCPALQDTVYFNADGLNHLLYVRRRPRSPTERHYRLSLVPHISEVISHATHAAKEIRSTSPLIVLWSLQHHVPRVGHITVVIRQAGAGRLYFLSTMKRKSKKA